MKYLFVVLMFGLSGCTSAVSPTVGSVFTNTKGPLSLGTGQIRTSKLGTAHSYGVYIPYVGSFAWGDSSIEVAKHRGQISEIAYADMESFSILGIFSKFETIVHGN